jgi:3-phenylpropionate/trans-cinnamate dioxygenase ferredoxin reductase subunit
MSDNNTFVIVGAGLAGASAAEALRDEGFTGRIQLVGSEAERPYIRPPLSKDYLSGSAEEDSPYVHPEAWYAEHNVELKLGHAAVDLDLHGHTVTLDNGDSLAYDKLLIATGASPRHLRIPGANLDGIYYLREFEDARKLRSALSSGGHHIVIIGAGWIGLEVAATARSLNNEVTVIGMEDTPLAIIVGAEIGQSFAELHRSHGIDLRMSTGTREVVGDGVRVTGVVIDTGETLPADFVVIGIGAIPNTEIAEKAGLTVDNGIVADQSLRTSDPDVYVAGDVANAFHPVLGRNLRVEHWANAQNEGPAAAKAMLGQKVAYDRVPYFYTDQYDLGMEYSGYPGAGKDGELVIRGDLAKREYIAFWLVDGKVQAGMNVNVWDVNPAVEELIRSGRTIDPARLADESVPLEEL